MSQSAKADPADRSAIAGLVTTTRGKPVAGAVVMIGGSSPSHRDMAAITNDQGSFRFERLLPGHYTLLVNAADYAMREEAVEVMAGAVSELVIRVRKERQ